MAEEEISETRIIEERVEFMVDPTASKVEQNPTKRTGYFLKPSLNLNALPPKLPKIQSFSSSSKPKVEFLCRSTPVKGWQTWVQNLEETHEPAWRKAGIFDAIKGSTYHIVKSTDLIYSLVKKWCPETNTFVFPWGETTVTLEDVFILGGFSPLGVSVSSIRTSLGEDVQQVENNLIKTSSKLKDKDYNLLQLRWQEHFMGCGNQIEYAAFLALWLARHVFPSINKSLVPRRVFAMAAMISCGAKLAFGPVILASIYRDLTLLKREIVGPLSSHCRGGSPLKLSSPLQLVQVWALERFPSLGPVPRMIHSGGIRLARWECYLRKLIGATDDIETCLDSARETFRWRPYSMTIEKWSLPMFYVNSGMWVVVDSDEEWKLFARCVMVGQLSGLDCVQNYNPHRVALQFGFDQDIPESIDICKSSELDCVQNFKGLKLYLPPRLHEGDITYRYFDWWRTRLDVQEMALVGCKRRNTTEKRVEKLAKTVDRSKELSRTLLQVGNDIGMTCSLNMQCVLTSEEDTGMKEDDEDEVWTINRSMGECSKINVSCNKLAETELSRGIDQEDGGMELAEMLLERKLGLIRPEEDMGNSEDVARERNQERNLIMEDMKMEKSSEYLEANVLHIGTPTECNGSLIRTACEDNPAEAFYQDLNTNHCNGQVAASLQVMDNCVHNPFVALFLQYESRISRLERVISALLVSNPT